jgi:hypothetical protein
VLFRHPLHGLRFPAEIISHCVWSYFRFSLSFRDVEEILAVRGVPSDMSRSENGASGVPWIRMGMSWIFWMFCPEPEGQEGFSASY